MTSVEPSAPPGTLAHEEVVQPGDGTVGEVKKGQILRIVDLEGQQVADFCSWSLEDPAEYCDMIYSTFLKGSWKLTEGDTLITKRCRPLWTIVNDTCGVHYSGGGFCSRDSNEELDIHQPGCRDTLEEQLAKHGLSPLYLSPSACFNVFMNFPYYPDGRWEILAPATGPGDHIDLRAEMDVLWAVSVCNFPGPPPCNGERPTPLKFELYDPT
jgi:uncharacterized protein